VAAKADIAEAVTAATFAVELTEALVPAPWQGTELGDFLGGKESRRNQFVSK
jgi:hypothetical protein